MQTIKKGITALAGDNGAAGRGTLLPGIAHGPGGDQPRRLVEVGVGQHQCGVFPAHLQLIFNITPGRLLRNPPPNLIGAGKGDGLNARVVYKRRTEMGPLSEDKVEYSREYACLGKHFGQTGRG